MKYIIGVERGLRRRLNWDCDSLEVKEMEEGVVY